MGVVVLAVVVGFCVGDSPHPLPIGSLHSVFRLPALPPQNPQVNRRHWIHRVWFELMCVAFGLVWFSLRWSSGDGSCEKISGCCVPSLPLLFILRVCVNSTTGYILMNNERDE